MPTVAVESGGPDVVVVTRGGGRYVTVQDLITGAKARSKSGGKLSMPVAALIGKSVIEALAAAHRAGLIHGAVHPGFPGELERMEELLFEMGGGASWIPSRRTTTTASCAGSTGRWMRRPSGCGWMPGAVGWRASRSGTSCLWRRW